jgi:hypothetical protein
MKITLFLYTVFGAITVNSAPPLPTCNDSAICYAGLYRSFGLKNVRDSLVRLKQLLQDKTQANVKTFLEIELPTPGEKWWFPGEDISITSFREKLEGFDRVEITTSNYGYPKEDVDHPGRPYHSNCTLWPGLYGEAPNFRKQFEKTSLCLDQVEQYEQRRGCRFSWIIRSREDVLYHPDHNPFKEWDLSLQDRIFLNDERRMLFNGEWKQPGDHFAITPRNLSEYYFRAYRAIDSVCEPLAVFRPLCHADWPMEKEPFVWQECLLYYYLRTHLKIKTEMIKVLLTPVRPDGTLRGYIGR